MNSDIWLALAVVLACLDHWIGAGVCGALWLLAVYMEHSK